jgi:membrane protein DedA with SNARE-associated domain
MTLEYFISNYGYFALFSGALIEELTFVVMAGFLAQEGYFSLSGVTLAAFFGAFISGQILFLFGKHEGLSWLERHPHTTFKMERARRFLARNQTLMILGFRYIYGLHTLGPIAMGISHVNTRRFTWLNASGAFIWAGTFACAGYAFGGALNVILVDLRHLQKHIMLFIACVGVAAWMIYRKRQKRRSTVEKPDPSSS